MKKIIAIILALSMALSLTGCGSTAITACFTGVDADRIVSTIHKQLEDNQVYCRLFTKNGDCIVSPDGEYNSCNMFEGLAQEGFSFSERVPPPVFNTPLAATATYSAQAAMNLSPLSTLARIS